MGHLIKGILYGFIAQVITFIQLQGSLRFGFLKNNLWLVLLMSIPVSWFFILSVRNFVEWANGAIWPSRLIGFSIGIIVFTLLSYIWFKEPITAKTLICLLLGASIMAVQILWK